MVAKHNMPSPPRSQRGVVIVFATLAMAVLIGASALALDVGNLVLSKGKLQNLADSAALGAAKLIDLGGDHNEAIAMGNQIISDNMDLDGFNAISLDDSNITYEFSESLPFDPSTATATSPYVRVRLENVDVPDFMVRLFNIDLTARASAVAGPSTSLARACSITPLSICKGDDTSTTAGYEKGTLHVLKAAKSQDSSIGSGNFMPIVLTETGANAYANALAGGYDACMDLTPGTPITTEPGNMDGPSLGIDTRFGIYKSIMNNPANKSKYKEDFDTEYSNNFIEVETRPTVDEENNPITDENGDPVYHYAVSHDDDTVFHDYEAYQHKYATNNYEACLLDSSCDKAFYRRIIAVPVIDCDNASKSGGRMTVPFVSLACFYLVQPMSQTKHVDDTGGSNGDWLVGEFIDDCQINSGTPGIEPLEEGPYKIVLYKDPDSEDS